MARGLSFESRGSSRKRVEVWFAGDPPVAGLKALPGLVDSVVDDHRLTAVLSGSIQPLLEVLARHPVVSMLVEEPDLEEAFLDLYAEAS